MARTSRDTWLNEALILLFKSGIDSVRIDTLCTRLNMTKGSFYHHFKNRKLFLEAILTYWEDKFTVKFIEFAEEGTTPGEKLKRLNQIALSTENDPEIHIRAWALTDEMAKETVSRVDQRRIDYLVQLYTDLGLDKSEALITARTIYSVLIGSQYLFPLLNQQDILEIFNFIANRNPNR
jgi:AcrR family transcriptional regulator